MITMGQAISIIICMLGLAVVSYMTGYTKGRQSGIDDFCDEFTKALLEDKIWKK